jgi:uncharacterized membrane protein
MDAVPQPGAPDHGGRRGSGTLRYMTEQPSPVVSSPGDTIEAYEVRAAAVERLTFFADAVVAIAITLLALDLPVPEGTTNHEVLSFVADQHHRDEYLAFLISFAVIGAHWRGHHRVFRYVTTLGGRLPRLTLLWLLTQVITPFATRVLTGGGAFQVRFIFYAGVQGLAGVLFLLMIREIRRFGLTREDTPPRMLRQASIQTAVLAAAFLVSIPISFRSAWAYACWAVIPIAGGFAARIARARSGRAAR